jgi:hypothetical protein
MRDEGVGARKMGGHGWPYFTPSTEPVEQSEGHPTLGGGGPVTPSQTRRAREIIEVGPVTKAVTERNGRRYRAGEVQGAPKGFSYTENGFGIAVSCPAERGVCGSRFDQCSLNVQRSPAYRPAEAGRRRIATASLWRASATSKGVRPAWSLSAGLTPAASKARRALVAEAAAAK